MDLKDNWVIEEASDEEVKYNVESLYDTLFRIKHVKNYSHCEYDINTNTVHIIYNK